MFGASFLKKELQSLMSSCTSVCVYTHICSSIFTLPASNTCMCVSLSDLSLSIYVYMCVCMCICVCVCVYE